MKEGYKLEDTIILNGKVGWVNTGEGNMGKYIHIEIELYSRC